MPQDRQTINVRRCIQAHFEGLEDVSVENCRETILIREGHYCGRRFDFGPWQAVWFVEEGEIKVYDPEGAVSSVFSVEQLQDVVNEKRVA